MWSMESRSMCENIFALVVLVLMLSGETVMPAALRYLS